MGKGSGGTRKSTPSNPKGLTQLSSSSEVAAISINANLRTISATKNIINAAESRIAQIEKDINSVGHPTQSGPIQLGTMSNPLILIIQKELGIEIKGKGLYTSTAALLHHRGGQKKARGKEVPFSELKTMPSKLSSMDIYIKDGHIVFTDYKNKYIVRLNQTIKMPTGEKIVANHISSSKIIDKKEFSNKGNGYRTIKKTS